MSGMKKIVILLMTLFVLFCAYWAVGRNIMINSVSSKINEMQSEGYKVIHKGLSVGGFPFKFRTRLAEPNITSPRSLDKPWSIKADDWRMEALTLNPLKWTGAHRGEARIDMRGPKGERWLFDARPFNINITARAGLDGELKALDVIGTKLKTQAVIGTLPPVIAIDEARLSVAPYAENMRYELNLESIFLEKETLKDFQKIFGPRIESLRGTVLAIGLTSLDDDAIELWKQTGQITSEGWHISWGDTHFKGGFILTLSEAGPSGIIRIDGEDIGALISRLEEANIFSSSQARNAKLAATLLPANQRGQKEITLTLRDGFLTLFGQKIFEL